MKKFVDNCKIGRKNGCALSAHDQTLTERDTVRGSQLQPNHLQKEKKARNHSPVHAFSHRTNHRYSVSSVCNCIEQLNVYGMNKFDAYRSRSSRKPSQSLVAGSPLDRPARSSGCTLFQFPLSAETDRDIKRNESSCCVQHVQNPSTLYSDVFLLHPDR